MQKLHLTADELKTRFDEMLDETSPEVSIGGYTFNPSQVLKDCDPIAYRCELANYADILIRIDGYEIDGY